MITDIKFDGEDMFNDEDSCTCHGENHYPDLDEDHRSVDDSSVKEQELQVQEQDEVKLEPPEEEKDDDDDNKTPSDTCQAKRISRVLPQPVLMTKFCAPER